MATAPLAADQVAELLALAKKSDSVELKLTVPEAAHRSTIDALGLDPLQAQIRQVFFFDTPDLALDKLGLRRQGPPYPGQGRRLGREAAAGRARPTARRAPLLAELRRRGRCAARGLRLLRRDEADAGSRRGAAGRPGQRPVKKLFSKEQKALYAEHARRDRARRSGDPRAALRAEAAARTRRSSAGASSPRRGSTRTGRGSSSSRRSASRASRSRSPPRRRAFLTERGVDLSGDQETKTRKALRFFAKQLQEA